MRIPRIHTDHGLAEGETIALGDAQSHYLKHVLRLKPGAALFLFNGREAVDYRAALIADGKRLGAHIEAAEAVHTESPLACDIIQGLGRGDHTDWTIQKTTEIGVTRILLFNAERTQSPLKARQLEKKLQHWRGVAISACEQCRRAVVPSVSFYSNLHEALTAARGDCRLLLDFEGEPLRALLREPLASAAILLGPEGGLNDVEIEQARQAGFEAASLGPRVLRTETAAVAALAIAQSCIGDMT